MKAVRIVDGSPQVVDAPEPSGRDEELRDPVVVDVVASSICGSDLHLIESGLAEGRILGHEFAGTTPDGTAVAVEPVGWCGMCDECGEGRHNHCSGAMTTYGVFADGGMAERIVVPAASLVPLPTGVALADASLVEPLAVAVHGVRRTRMAATDRVAIIGAGPIGLALVAACRADGVVADVAARHDHQAAAVARLGGTTDVTGGYDIVFDAVGSDESLSQSIATVRAEGRIGLVGTLWSPASVDVTMCMKELEVIASMMYAHTGAESDFEAAARVLAAAPEFAAVMLTHRYPLDAATEAFATAADRSAGAIKVVFEPGG